METVANLQIGTTKIIESIFHAEKRVGHGIFTVKSKKTGKDYTYKVKTTFFKGRKFIHCYVETGYLQFKYLGFYVDGKLINKKSPYGTHPSPSAVGLIWILDRVNHNQLDVLETQCQFYHTGSCCRCGRELTDVNSIEIGLGPVCATI